MRSEIKQFFIYSLLGLFFGVICAYMATIRKPVPITKWILIATVYNRLLIGVGLFLLIKLKTSINQWLASFIVGFIISLSLSLAFGPSGLGFAIIGGVYAILIKIIAIATEKIFKI